MGFRQLIRAAHLGLHYTLCPKQTQAGLWLLLKGLQLLFAVSSLPRPTTGSVCPFVHVHLCQPLWELSADANTVELFSTQPFTHIHIFDQLSCSHDIHFLSPLRSQVGERNVQPFGFCFLSPLVPLLLGEQPYWYS